MMSRVTIKMASLVFFGFCGRGYVVFVLLASICATIFDSSLQYKHYCPDEFARFYCIEAYAVQTFRILRMQQDNDVGFNSS